MRALAGSVEWGMRPPGIKAFPSFLVIACWNIPNQIIRAKRHLSAALLLTVRW